MEKLNFLQKKINKVYYFLFKERFSKKINFNYEDIPRWDLIDFLNTKHKFSSYLEIGCDNDELFSKINIDNKIGIDPEKGGNLKITSDNFFLQNSKKFDCIFIDGLHRYHQVIKDIKNSLNILNPDGVILLHDCLPNSYFHQAIPRCQYIWNGDVWKAIVDLRHNNDLNIYTCEIDQGIGIIKKGKNTSILKVDKKIKDLKFKDYYENYNKYLRVININEFKKMF